jgi:Fe-Mn family superoxide dismutase
MPKHALPSLPYAPDALEPFYDEATVKIHHGKHHKAYVDNLNAALAGHPDLELKSLEELLEDPGALPEAIRHKVLHNAGGHFNHSLFWKVMAPGRGETPSGEIDAAIRKAFGGYESFKARWRESALDVFGSGWTFLLAARNGDLEIRNFADQKTPAGTRMLPVLLIDVWEHAYYLKFQNRRAEWIDAWWNVVDWDAVNARYVDRTR